MQNPMDMSGRTVMVTGASAGLGTGVAQLLAGLGARVVLVGRDVVRLEAVRAGLTGAAHEVRNFNLANPDEIAPWMQEISKGLGPLHGLVHCAGVMLLRPLRILKTEEWESAMRINVIAASALTKGFRQRGVNAGWGSVVYLASVAGLAGQPAQSLYGATKGALIAMTRSLAVELAREQIRVNCVAPAVVEAGMSDQIKSGVSHEQWEQIVAQHPLGLGRPADVANAVTFLLADTGRWITGTTLVVDGGYLAQ